MGQLVRLWRHLVKGSMQRERERESTLKTDKTSANDDVISYLKKNLSTKSGVLVLGGEFFT